MEVIALADAPTVPPADLPQMDVRAAQLLVTPHPLTTQGQVSVAVLMVEGETLLSVLQRHGVNDTWTVEVGGLQVPALMWGRTRVHHAQVIECRQALREDLVKIVAIAALAYFTMGAGNAWLAGVTGLAAGGVGVAIAGALVFAAGAAVINRLLPPPKRGGMDVAANTTEPTYSLSGGRNQIRAWQPMSLVLGQPYVVPDLAGQPYTFFAGEDQYLVQQFHAGINCRTVSNLRIGQTGIEDFQGVDFRSYGLPGNSHLHGLPANSVDSIAGGLLDAPGGPGPWVQRTTSPNTLQIGIDIEGNVFGVSNSNGAYESRTVLLEIQYALAGSGNWIGWPTGATYRESYSVFSNYGWVMVQQGDSEQYAWQAINVTEWRDVPYAAGTASLTNASSKPLRMALHIQVPAGQYDVRLRKLTANETSTSAQNAVQWTQLKSYQQDLRSYPGQGIFALTIKASGQLNGAVDELNWTATAKPMPYWNGSAWVTASDRSNGLSNPGAQILQLARGIFDENGKLIAGLGWPDSRIDVDGLKRFMVWCAAKGLMFDAIIQEPMSHEDLMNAIAYAGLATLSWAEGRLGVQWLDDAAPVEGVINMGNIKARSFSVSYDTNDRADEIEYGYFDRARSNSWNSLRVLAPGVSQPRTTARLSNMGITSEAHAALLARHAMAQNIYMAKAITFEQDLEFLTYRRGTVLALSHDMTQWGYSGRVQQASQAGGVVTLTLDDAIPATGPGGASSRYMGLRLAGETQYRVFSLVAFAGSTRTVQLVGAWPAGVALPTLDALWIYDFKATPGQRVVVARIEPSDNMAGARVTVVPLPNEFWPYVLTGAYTPPPNNSLLNRLPVVSGARVTELLKRQGNTYFTELTVSFDLADAPGKVSVFGGLNGGPLQLLGNTETRQLTWVAGLAETWDIELRSFNSLGQPGNQQRVRYAVAGLSVPPANVLGLSLAVGLTGVQATWLASLDLDYADTTLRTGISWDSAALVVQKAATTHELGWLPVGVYTLWARHQDTTGNVSEPVSASINITRPAVVQGLTLASGSTGLQAAWVLPGRASTAQPIDRVELSYSANFASLLQSTSATSVQLPWATPGLKELFVRAVDVGGNVGDAASVSLTVRSPSPPVGLAVAIGTSGAVASWGAPGVAQDQQPLAGVQLSWQADFAQVIETRSATRVELGWLSVGTRTLYARYTDAAGNTGSAASVSFTVAAPSAPASLELAFGNSSIEAKWQTPAVGATQQALERVELSWGPAFSSIIDGRKATTTTFGWLSAGVHTLYARYVDVAGNVGAVSQSALQVLPPAQVSMTAVETQINMVTLRWQDAKTSQPIKKYAIYFGEAGTPLASAALYGSAGADSRSDILQYRSSGLKVAYLVAEDVAGNVGAARQIDLNIKMPDNFVLASEYYQDWQPSELVNGSIVGGPAGQILLPANEGRTWGQRLSNGGWTTAQQKVDAGYPVVIQQVPSSGKHVERKDLGKVLATSVVRVQPTVLSTGAPGSVSTIRIRASVGASTTVWQPWLVGESASFNNFQHVEVEYGVTSDGKGFVVVDDLYIKVEVTEVTESATLVLNPADAAGTVFVCTKPFWDVRQAQVTPLGASSINRTWCVIDDAALPAKVYVFATDSNNARTGGTVSLFVTGV